MPWTIDGHQASAEEAIARGVISGDAKHLADVPEPQQSSEHQARVAALSLLNELGGSGRVVVTPWQPGMYPPAPPPVEPPVEPPIEPPVPPPSGTPKFGTRPAASSPIRPSSANVVENLYFNGRTNDKFIYRPGKPSNSHVCILTTGQDILLRNCDFEDVSQPFAVIGGGKVTIENCRAKGIVGPGSRVNQQTGNFVQTVNSPRNVTIRGNTIIATTTFDPWNGQYELMTEDVISLFSAYDSIVEDNYIEATGYVRDYGTGIIAGDSHGDNATIRRNTLVNAGQVGIAVAGGSGHRVDANIIYRSADENFGSGNTAAYCWDYNGGTPTNNVVFSNNRARYEGGGGFWNPGPPPAAVSNNNWRDTTLTYASLARTIT